MKLSSVMCAALASVATLTGAAAAQQPAGTDTMPGPKVGAMAPDFAIPGATRYGLLRDPVRLSDFRGSTVVLAFIVQARTRG